MLFEKFVLIFTPFSFFLSFCLSFFLSFFLSRLFFPASFSLYIFPFIFISYLHFFLSFFPFEYIPIFFLSFFLSLHIDPYSYFSPVIYFFLSLFLSCDFYSLFPLFSQIDDNCFYFLLFLLFYLNFNILFFFSLFLLATNYLLSAFPSLIIPLSIIYCLFLFFLFPLCPAPIILFSRSPPFFLSFPLSLRFSLIISRFQRFS